MDSERPNFDIIVNREQFINRILVPISRFSAKAVIMLEGDRLYALANLSSENTGQMFMLSDIKMDNTIPEKAEMVLTGVSKMITALKAVSDDKITLHYDGTGLDYHSNRVSFRVRLSSETVAIPFKKDKVMALKVLGTFWIGEQTLRGYASLLSGFPNLNQMLIANRDSGIVFHNTDRGGVTDEVLDYAIEEGWLSGGPPDNFIIYNNIFRSTSLAALGNIKVNIGAAFAMVISQNDATNEQEGSIRYILPKLKERT